MNRTVYAFVSLCALLLVSTPAAADMKAALAALDANEYQKSAKMLAEAFEAGEYDAAFYMGRILELGMTGNPDIEGAVALYAAGSAKGSALSKNRLGILHMEGKGVLQDFKQGAKLICEAADSGENNAQFNCGSLYLEGKGVSADKPKAYAYLEKASTNGNIAAKNTLADAYAQGADVPTDPKKAFSLWQQTAAVGNPYGLFALAKAYASGTGTTADPVKAHAYANLAAARGFPGAAELRGQVESKMSADAVVEAQQIARGWRSAATDERSSIQPVVTEASDKKPRPPKTDTNN